jgi:hypothetical protein
MDGEWHLIAAHAMARAGFLAYCLPPQSQSRSQIPSPYSKVVCKQTIS